MKHISLIYFILLVLTFSCKEDEVPLDPCRLIGIELTTINNTNADIILFATVYGCSVEIGSRSELFYDNNPTSTTIESLSWYGADELCVCIRNIDNDPNDEYHIEFPITMEDQKFTLLVTFDGTDYIMEFI